jgi:2-C-methyl-D-erythritol 2,4-cyclodiphosphate synthase
MFRIGFGFDTHRLEEGFPFWLGGIAVQHSKGAIGHSDADVLIHAICDAILGAAGLRDIGFQFPDSSPEFKGIDSKVLLARTCDILKEKHFSIANIDSTVVLQSPKISDLIPQMITQLAEVMNISEEQVSVKAKTSENLGFIGREEGVSAYAICLIQKML